MSERKPPRGNPCRNTECIARNGAGHTHLSMADRVPNGNPLNDRIAAMQAAQRAERQPVGCAYSRGEVETRAGCTCPVCEASRYYRPMADAIADAGAESRATRDARTARDSDPLGAAKLDYDVAMATARADEELAVTRARESRERAEANAKTLYSAACRRIEMMVAAQRADVASYASMGDKALLEALQMEAFRLSRTRNRMRAEIQAESAVKVDAMRAELTGRGVEIPRWKFEGRTAT